MDSGKRILITGATGFIGRYLTQMAINQGYEVYILARKSSNLEVLDRDKIKVCFGGLLDQNLGEVLPENLSAVIHLAGEIRSPNQEGFDRVNNLGTQNLIQSLLKTNSNFRFVFISSIAATGPKNGTGLKKDSDLDEPVSSYGLSKLKAEASVKEFIEDWVIVRPPLVYGEEDSATLNLFKSIKHGIAFLSGYKDGVYSLVYVKELAEGILATLNQEKAKSETFYFTDGKPASWKEFNLEIAKALNKNVIFIRIPLFILSIAAIISDLISKLIGKGFIFGSSKLAEAKALNWTFDDSKARKLLSYKSPADRLDNLKNQYLSYKQKGWL